MTRCHPQNPTLACLGLSILALLLAALPALAQSQPSSPVTDEATAAALSLAAQQAGVPETDLTILASTSVSFQLTGALAYNFKIGHEDGDEI